MLTGNPDMCDALHKKSDDSRERLAMFGFPTECPVPEGRKCFEGDKKMNVTKFKNYLNLINGKMEIDADIEHDTVGYARCQSQLILNAFYGLSDLSRLIHNNNCFHRYRENLVWRWNSKFTSDGPPIALAI